MTVLRQIYDSFMKILGPTLDKSTGKRVAFQFTQYEATLPKCEFGYNTILFARKAMLSPLRSSICCLYTNYYMITL